jgi:hypothetical protein
MNPADVQLLISLIEIVQKATRAVRHLPGQGRRMALAPAGSEQSHHRRQRRGIRAQGWRDPGSEDGLVLRHPLRDQAGTVMRIGAAILIAGVFLLAWVAARMEQAHGLRMQGTP